MTKFRYIGQSLRRKEGESKVTGRAKYVDDVRLDGMLHGVTVRSTVPRAKIKSITFDPSIPWNEFTVVTAKDIPGSNYVALIDNDQPYLADGITNHPEEAIVLLAHPDRYMAERGRQHVKIEYEELPALLSMEESLNKKQIIWRQDNVFKHILIEKGDVSSVWSKADHVIEGEYHTGAQEQLYIENNGMIATYDPNDGVTVWGSLQCPYYIQKALKTLFALPDEKIRVVQCETGGGFGGKEEYPSMLAGHAALLAMKARRPVKMIYSRAEDMAATTKRHPSRTRHKTAVRKDGKILGMQIDFLIDGGAYATLSAVVLSRGTIHAAGPYACDNIRIESHAVATNHPPHGAFRGFGAPQSIFAMERHLDEIAAKIGITAEQIRRVNFLKTGEKTATGQVITEDMNFSGLLDQALQKSDYHNKMKTYAAANKTSRIKRGIGFATFMHGAGFTGSGEKNLRSMAGVAATADGRIRVLAASTEIGQGTNTVFSQIASDSLKVDYDVIEVQQPDTSIVPDSGPTVASRTVMVVGKLIERSCADLLKILQASKLLGAQYSSEEFRDACKKYIAAHGKLQAIAQYQPSANIQWDDKTYLGDAYASYAWAVYVADVAVDTTTYETRVEDFVALQEAGRVINPVMAAGQIEGGVAQAIGYAIYEKVVWKQGRMINNQMTNYIMPTAVDVPPIRVFFIERNLEHGPAGAKGIGELPMDGPAPAIINAVRAATGIAHNEIPMLPEDLFARMRSQQVTHA